MQPIWKDYFVELTDSSSDYEDGIQFRIKTGGTIIYQGRAFAIPGDDSISVRINDICADMFYHTGLYNTLYRTFTTEILDYDTEVWTQVDSVTFRPDWSWDASYNPETMGCSCPINGILHPLQDFPVSCVGSDEVDVAIHNSRETGSFCRDFNDDFQVHTDSTQYQTYSGNEDGHEHWMALTSYPYAEYLEVEGQKWTIKDLCGGVVLYYINAYGYWDSFVPEGKPKVVDNLTRHTRKLQYTNGPYASARSIADYANEIARKVTFRTGPLTTAQSKRMHHLLNSPYVIMHDLERGERWPIILTGNNSSYQNASGRLHYYDIEAQLAQDMVRR